MFVTTNLITYLTISPSQHLNISTSQHLNISPPQHHLNISPPHHLTITACTSSIAALAASTTPSASQASSATFLTICVAAYRPKNSQNVLSEKPSHHRVAAITDKYVC